VFAACAFSHRLAFPAPETLLKRKHVSTTRIGKTGTRTGGQGLSRLAQASQPTVKQRTPGVEQTSQTAKLEEQMT